MNDQSVGPLLREVAILFDRVQREGVACCGGTTAAQCSILTDLGRSGPVTLAELTRRLVLDKGWVSRAVETLAQEGLVQKEPSEHDRRAIRIALTAAGETRCRELNDALNAQAERILARLPATEQAAAVHSLFLLRQALKAETAQTASCEVKTDD